jgi:hypothetical protein
MRVDVISDFILCGLCVCFTTEYTEVGTEKNTESKP